MNKNVLAVFAAVCGMFMVSCDTPTDLRPGAKVSVDYVPPGQRNTPNLSDAGVGQRHLPEDEIMINHDPGANTIEKGDSIPEGADTQPEGVINR